MMALQRIRGALEVIQVSIAGQRGDDIRWNLGWCDAFRRIRVDDALKSCRELSFDGSDGEKREAKIAARIIRRGREFVKQIEEVECECADLYPQDRARHRLDAELGWDNVAGEDFATKLDRSMMVARANAPSNHIVRATAHGIIRARFSDLEVAEN